MKRHIAFRAALASLALAGLSVAAAGCGSGLFDTEDEKLEPSMSVALGSTSTLVGVGYGDVADLDMNVTLKNATFDDAFVTALSDAASAAVDISDYFDVRFISNGGSDDTDTLVADGADAVPLSLTATSAVAATPVIISKGEATYSGATSKFSVHLTVEINEPAGAGAMSGSLVLRAKEKSGQTGLSGTASSYSFNVVVADWGLELPTAGQIIAAYKDNKKFATVVTLKNRTKKAISAGDTVGMLKSGSSSYSLVALTNASRKSRRIPVGTSRSGGTFTGDVSITINTDYVDTSDLENGAFSHDNAADSIAVPYFGEDFTYDIVSLEHGTYYKFDAAGTQTAATEYEYKLSGKAVDENYNVKDNYIAWATWLAPAIVDGALVHDGTSQSGPRGVFTYDGDHLWGSAETGLPYADKQKYAVEFDLTVGAGTELYLYNRAVKAERVDGMTVADAKSAGAASSTIDAISGLYTGNIATGLGAAIENYVWGIASTSAGSHHYSIVVEYSATSGESKVTPYLDGTAGTTVSDIGGGDAQGITINTARGTKTTLDNIVVYGLGQ